MKNENIKDIIAENRRRTARLADNYDPISGQGCLGERITVRRRGGKDVLVPATMTADPSYRKQMSAHDFNQLRQRHDFEYWCATCVTVKDKSGYADVRLRLNRPQRIIAGVLERQRTASQPIRAMQAEYPLTADEAFTATDRGVFDTDGIARLRTECRQPASTGEICGNAVKGREALRNVHFTADSAGRLKIWKHPEQSVSTDRYLTIVDIGGRSDTSDYSVIAVVDRHGDGNRPEIVAQWRGHTDHDLLAWNASQIATYYRKALLIVESNTIETERTEGENSGYILDEIADYYDNVYYRRSGEGSTAMRPGFHTNRQTKPLIVNNLVAAVRDGSYTERDSGAVDELQTYERKPNGTFGAKDGHHDDILMTRCIGLFIAQEMARNGGCDITALKRPFC